MAQNVYDDPDFLAGYSGLDRQRHGLGGAPEWPAMRAMIPDPSGLDVVDLGCGFGWLSRWAVEGGAATVTGLDVSTSMLERAQRDNLLPGIEYRRADLDSVELLAVAFDIAISSLAIHYVRDIDRLFATLATSLRPGGSFVFSVEHPIFSAPSQQAFEQSSSGRRIWPLENYLVEGERVTNWFTDGVIKHHRTIASYANALIGAGLTLTELDEWGPSAEAVAADPALADDRHRPWFLLIAAMKPPIK